MTIASFACRSRHSSRLDQLSRPAAPTARVPRATLGTFQSPKPVPNVALGEEEGPSVREGEPGEAGVAAEVSAKGRGRRGHQIFSPTRVNTAGTITVRTIRVSTRTPRPTM